MGLVVLTLHASSSGSLVCMYCWWWSQYDPAFSLDPYATNKWTLKHTVSTLKLFGKTNIRFGYVDYDLAYTAITIHLEWILIFFVGA